MRDAQIVKPRKKSEVVETITTFQVRDVPKVKANPIRLKSRSRTPSGGMDRAVKRAADEALQSMSARKSDRNKGPSPEEDPPGIEPMSLIPREIRERREDRDRERSPSPEEGTREVRMNDDRGRSEAGSEERRDDHHRKRFRYEETSSDSEMNCLSQGENSQAALNVVWATVDSGAATSCVPVELCQEEGLEVESTSDLPYTNASGAPVKVHGICHPKVTIGNQDGSKVAGTGTFKAMDVAKPLLSVARLVNKGWEVCFKPGNSYMKFQDATIPLEEKGGVYKIPLNLEGFQGHRAG